MDVSFPHGLAGSFLSRVACSLGIYPCSCKCSCKCSCDMYVSILDVDSLGSSDKLLTSGEGPATPPLRVVLRSPGVSIYTVTTGLWTYACLSPRQKIERPCSPTATAQKSLFTCSKRGVQQLNRTPRSKSKIFFLKKKLPQLDETLGYCTYNISHVRTRNTFRKTQLLASEVGRYYLLPTNTYSSTPCSVQAQRSGRPYCFPLSPPVRRPSPPSPVA